MGFEGVYSSHTQPKKPMQSDAKMRKKALASILSKLRRHAIIREEKELFMHSYLPQHVCAKLITFDLSDDLTVHEFSFFRGCSGNALGIAA